MARAGITVSSGTSTAAITRIDDLKDAIRTEVARLINEAADIGGDGYYRNAIKRESKAQALIDVNTFINTGRWPHTGESGKSGPSPSETLAAEYGRMT